MFITVDLTKQASEIIQKIKEGKPHEFPSKTCELKMWKMTKAKDRIRLTNSKTSATKTVSEKEAFVLILNNLRESL
jgi:hypothetical protein